MDRMKALTRASVAQTRAIITCLSNCWTEIIELLNLRELGAKCFYKEVHLRAPKCLSWDRKGGGGARPALSPPSTNPPLMTLQAWERFPLGTGQ